MDNIFLKKCNGPKDENYRKDWEKEKSFKEYKDICASCSKRFKNSPDYYIIHGNYCPNCISKILMISEYMKLIRTKRNEEAEIVLDSLKMRWGITKDYIVKVYQNSEEIKKMFKI